MKAKVYGWHTDVFPTDTEVKEICKPGAGADTCVWLTMGAKGWQCTCLNKPGALMDRWKAGETVAKRDGCASVENFKPTSIEPFYEGIEVEIPII